MMSSIIWAKKLRLLIWLSMLTATTAGARQIPAAAIIPGLSNLLGSNKDEENSKTKEAHDSQSMLSRHQQEGLRKLPPPPPPPRNRGHDDVTGARLANTKDNPDEGDTKAMDRNESFPDYPPHPQFWAPGPFETYGGLPPPPPVWMDPSTGWGVDQSAGDTHQLLQQAMARESRLLMEIENLTCAIASYRQRDDLHMRQLDVLTERVVDTEATAARERNEIIELRTNCTDLGRTIAILKDEVEEWAQKCGNLTLQHDQDEEKLQEMKALVKERTREVEDLAAIIETSRIEQELALDGWTKKKQRGFFAWLFGMVSPENDAQDRLKVREQRFFASIAFPKIELI
jgi:DNA repair exonuclease SbcCD ATPase subunit